MTTTTTSFIRTWRKNRRTFRDRITVKRTPSTLSESNKSARWFDYCGEQIVAVFEVEVTVEMVLDVDGETRYSGGDTPAKYTEIVTANGRGCITRYRGPSEELTAFVLNNGHALLNGCYIGRKYGSRRGSAIPYIMAMGCNPNSRKKVTERCAAALYGAVNGEFEKWHIEAA